MPTITKSITILPGECFTLPKGAIVTAISDILTNSCDFDLPTPTPLKCYRFSWEITNNVGNQDQAWDNENANNKFTNISLNGVNYPISVSTSEPITLYGEINNLLSSKGIVVIQHGELPVAGNDISKCLVDFKAFPSAASSFIITVQLSEGSQSIRLVPVEITCP